MNSRLITACARGDYEIVKQLCEAEKEANERGADLCVKNNRAFLEACSYGHLAVAQLLTAYGVNVDANNYDAFLVACKNGQLEVAKWLWTLGVDIHRRMNFAFKIACSCFL